MLEIIANYKEMILPLVIMFIVTMLSTAWKDMLKNLVNQIKRTVSVTVYIANNTWIYHKFMYLLEISKSTDKTRFIKFDTGREGQYSVISLSLGVGVHLLKYKGKTLFIRIIEKDNKWNDDSLGMIITALGRDNRWVKELRDDLYSSKYDFLTTSGVNILRFHWDIWDKSIRIKERDLKSIFIPVEQKKKLIKVIEDFKNGEDWYERRGINYQLGILLSGPPGTGKTSIIKALASYFKVNICVLRISELNKLEEAIIDLPTNSFLVIEDIDSSKLVHEREGNEEIVEKTVINVPLIGGNKDDEKKDLTLSDILNILDGLVQRNGRILFVTTNHPNNIDRALLRPGRIDYHCKLGYVDEDVFVDFLRSYFEVWDYELPEGVRFEKGKNVTVAMLQNDYLQNKLDLDGFLNKYTADIED